MPTPPKPHLSRNKIEKAIKPLRLSSRSIRPIESLLLKSTVSRLTEGLSVLVVTKADKAASTGPRLLPWRPII
jgi:hypothetical protein